MRASIPHSDILLIDWLCARIAAAFAGSMVVAGSKISLRFPALLGGGVPKSALFMGIDYPQCAVFSEGSSLPLGRLYWPSRWYNARM